MEDWGTFRGDTREQLAKKGLVKGIKEETPIEEMLDKLIRQNKNGLEIFLLLSRNFKVNDVLAILKENGIRMEIPDKSTLSALDYNRIEEQGLIAGDKGKGGLEK